MLGWKRYLNREDVVRKRFEYCRHESVNTVCQICNKRRARRHCPGVGGEICPQCCGEQRENTIDCPSDCEHLREARHREVGPPIAEADIPNRDVALSEQFVREHEPLIYAFAMALRRAMEEQRAVDFDAREALAALIRTYRTLESGLIYETQPTNPYAAAILDRLKASIENLRKVDRTGTRHAPVTRRGCPRRAGISATS